MKKGMLFYFGALLVSTPGAFLDLKAIPDIWNNVWFGVQMLLMVAALAAWALEGRDGVETETQSQETN